MISVKGLGEAEGTGYPVVPNGKYPVQITKIEEKELGENSKYPGNPALKISIKFTEGEHTGHVLVFTQTIPSENMEPDYFAREVNKLKRLIKACGLDANSDEFDPSDLQGAEFTALVVQKKGQDGELVNNVKDTLPM